MRQVLRFRPPIIHAEAMIRPQIKKQLPEKHMSDYIIRTGDTVEINIGAPGEVTIPAIVNPLPLSGTSSKFEVEDQSVCLQGDEEPEAIKVPVDYFSIQFPEPGNGTIELTLESNNTTSKTECEGMSILIKGGQFRAKFTVEVPATNPAASTSDVEGRIISGSAKFGTTNKTTKAG
ncbi:hypothetical protein [Streptomyces sp. NPDC092307]|uniref:hypothetical protein n=1 Tax=Streptomyces sp. NPDC092307 TaxID=3366013 RepID=UPI00381E0C3F